MTFVMKNNIIHKYNFSTIIESIFFCIIESSSCFIFCDILFK
jgi:hypothetical protein